MPLLFGAVALRAPAAPAFRPGLVLGLLLGAALIVPTALVAVATATDPTPPSWSADLSSFGTPLEDAGLDGVDVTVDEWGQVRPEHPLAGEAWDALRIVDVDIALESGAPAPFVSVRGELLSATVSDGVVRFGDMPLGVAEETADSQAGPAHDFVSLRVPVPALRDPVPTALIVAGVRPDGSRVVLDADLSLIETPPWRGTLWEWWFGAP